ncbi:Protein FANTASTIC FOUR 3 [Striga hermonthica]|uniref:Protein FANTASTIC FOUR 3 n=1 Tax=Striga hermonthica TaxID=68872 RepID=A0A9N7NX70_STRHE|nr:Protein FANTASTIC FOUR 3 [Striga hermonthica]
MSTIVYQSLESASSTTLKLKVAPPSPAVTDGIDRSAKLEFGNWGFLQTATRETGEYYRDTKPWANKSSFSSLSAKSLELCTENLGSETGSDILIPGAGDDDAVFSYPLPLVEQSTTDINAQIDTYTKRHPDPPKITIRREARSFPPPLTSMIGENSVQVRRHREGGRLIIEAVEAPFKKAYLHAERSDGRLRLSYVIAEATIAAVAAGEKNEDEDGSAAAEEEEEEEKGEIEEIGSELGSELDGETAINGENEGNLEKYKRQRRCNEERSRSRWKPSLCHAIS